MPKAYTAKPEIRLNGNRRKGIERDRWISWATLFRARYMRVGYRCRTLAMLLAENRAVTFHRVNKWYTKSLKLVANLRLSVSPFIQGYAAPSARLTLKQLPRRAGKSSIQQVSGNEPLTVQHLPSRKPSSFQLRGEASHAPVLLPLQRVSCRLDETINKYLSTRFDVLTVAQSSQLISRVFNERKRLEQQTTRTVMSADLRTYPKPSTRPVERTLSESTNMTQSVSGRMVHTPSDGITLDLERLTDQVVRNIDNRMLAHRERMGGVF